MTNIFGKDYDAESKEDVKFFQNKIKDKEAQISGSSSRVQNYGEETMYIDHYSGTFYSMITKYKKMYHLLSEDQAQYYFEALFLLFIQTIFCVAILTSDQFSFETAFEYKTSYAFSLCLYFSCMMLHFGSIYTIRNGILMIKYVIYHSEEFDHPHSAFMLGLLVVLVNMFCEVTNLFNSLSQSTVTGVISKFVAFKILIQVQDYYNRSRANFRIRGAVSSYPLVVVTDMD